MASSNLAIVLCRIGINLPVRRYTHKCRPRPHAIGEHCAPATAALRSAGEPWSLRSGPVRSGPLRSGLVRSGRVWSGRSARRGGTVPRGEAGWPRSRSPGLLAAGAVLPDSSRGGSASPARAVQHGTALPALTGTRRRGTARPDAARHDGTRRAASRTRQCVAAPSAGGSEWVRPAGGRSWRRCRFCRSEHPAIVLTPDQRVRATDQRRQPCAGPFHREGCRTLTVGDHGHEVSDPVSTPALYCRAAIATVRRGVARQNRGADLLVVTAVHVDLAERFWFMAALMTCDPAPDPVPTPRSL